MLSAFQMIDVESQQFRRHQFIFDQLQKTDNEELLIDELYMVCVKPLRIHAPAAYSRACVPGCICAPVPFHRWVSRVS